MRSPLFAVTLLPLLTALELGGQPSRAPEHDALHTLFAEEWELRLKEDPLFATSVGDHRYDDRLPSMSVSDLARRADFERKFLVRLEAMDRSRLSREDQVSYDVFRVILRDAVDDFEQKGYRFPITVDDGFHIGLARLPKNIPLVTTKDYESYVARLRAVPAYVNQHVGLMREGIETGWTLPSVVLQGYEGTIAAHVVGSPQESVFHVPFQNFPRTVPATDRERLRSEGERAIREAVVPAYRTFLDFMVKEYMPRARASLGASDLPGGRAYYAYLVRHFTTLDVKPETIHSLGLEEVRRIRAEMEGVIRETGFQGDFARFLDFLRTDPRFYAKTPEELLKQAAWIAKRMDGKLPSLIGKLPRKPYGVAPVPDELAPKYTGGRYVSSPVGGTEPGYYWVNTYALESRPLYTLEALTLHEAVPGHHLQISLAQELSDLPPFRRHVYVDAFGEGWGLYSERLGLEAGFYTDPYGNFGRLTYEMWRACRLVVDTGVHAMGWTREQVLDYLASNTALSLHEVRTETDRYISWPGQALAYKMGELKIRELRRRAEQALGTRFDVRAFHDAVLGNGAIPLSVLEAQIDAWIEVRQR